MGNTIIAVEIAKHFMHHLHEENMKSPELIDTIRFDGRTARDINTELIGRLKQEFPGIEESYTQISYNFIREWSRRNEFVYSYDEFAYEAYNLIFFERILCIRDWSAESIKRFHEHVLSIFSKFDYEQKGFSVSFFMRTENNMREILREIVAAIPGINHDSAWELVFNQSKEYQEVVNEFFEQILKMALQRSEDLLHNILPVTIAEELKEKGKVEPVYVESATVLFTDFKGFTKLSEEMTPARLIAELDRCFSIFDAIIEKHGLEKIKTIGDSYMCAGGIPNRSKTHVIDVALASLEMRDALKKIKEAYKSKGKDYWEARIGFHSGPLVSGVIAKKKFSYDIWGDTVNTASRMESSGEPGRVNISGHVYEHLKEFFDCEYRGKIPAKNKGDMEMYFLNRLKKEFSADESGVLPNARFMKLYENIKDE